MISLAEKSLNELSKIVFSHKYDYIEGPQNLRGKSGKVWKFDAIVNDSAGGTYGVFIRDWKREISITQLRQLHKACTDVSKITGGIMICNIISEFSRQYSSQVGILLLSRGHLISKIRNTFL